MKPGKHPEIKNPLAEDSDRGVFLIEVHPLRALIGLAAGLLLCITVVGLLAWGSGDASAFGSVSHQEAPADAIQAPQAPSASYPSRLRKFYLDKDLSAPSSATTACATGYHFASLWELIDPSNLQYDFSHIDAINTSDSGEGPPIGYGWVRTGYGADFIDVPGQGNCNNWTSNSTSLTGTLATLSSTWVTGTNFINDIWWADPFHCGSTWYVWCIED